MKFLSIRDFRASTASIRKALKSEGELVLTHNGRPFAVLSPVDPDKVEEQITAVRRARARITLDRIREGAKAEGLDGISMNEIDGIIANSRRNRRSKAGRKK